MTKTVYLIRHCEAIGQEANAPLTELGQQQAVALAEWLASEAVERIVASPFLRASQTALPLSQLLRLPVETDARLCERVLSGIPLTDWQQQLENSFRNLDLCLPGGEASRAAMQRGLAALADINQHAAETTVVVTHGNLMTLILKAFDDAVGFAAWQNLTNPDVYRLKYSGGTARIEHITI